MQVYMDKYSSQQEDQGETIKVEITEVRKTTEQVRSQMLHACSAIRRTNMGREDICSMAAVNVYRAQVRVGHGEHQELP